MDAHRHHVHSSRCRNDEQAALWLQERSVFLTGALREDEQALTVLAAGHRLVNDGRLFLGAAHTHGTGTAEKPAQERVDLKQLFFGKNDHPPAPEPGDEDKDRVNGGDVVGGQNVPPGPNFFQVVPALCADTEPDVEHDPCQREQDII